MTNATTGEAESALPARVSTGIPGLDEILGGGLPQGHLYLLEGESGAGKTTAGLQFLLDGRRRGEPTLWITLSESERELQAVARSHGWSLDGIELCNPSTLVRAVTAEEQYSFFSPADVELDEIWKAIKQAADRVRPTRVVFDPFSEIRLLSREALRYRRQVLGLRDFFAERGTTVLLTEEMTEGTGRDHQAATVVHGYLTLQQDAPEYGGQRRRVRVHKMRGISFRDGFHDVVIRTGGIEVYPRLIASDHVGDQPEEEVTSDVPALDALLGGGVARGSSLLILGAAGVGKSTVATQYAVSSARRGEHAAVFVFDETARTFRMRSEKLGLSVRKQEESGTLSLLQIHGAVLSPGLFTHLVMDAVEAHGARVIVIDSLSGYLHSMPEEHLLSTHLHELLTYLAHRNVVTILTVAQHGLVGDHVAAPVDVSYLADNVMLLRYFEAHGAIHRAVSVVKKRAGDHEVHVRDLRITGDGITIGEPLSQFRGVLSGNAEYTGSSAQLEAGH